MGAEMNLDRVRTFLEVYRAGSLSRAARSLGISQPSVTAHIAALERELATALFERSATGVTPTARADELATRVAAHVDALESALWDAVAPHNDRAAQRVIHLAGPTEYLSARVLPRLTSWVPEGAMIRARFALADALLSELLAGTHDVVVSSVPVHRAGLQSLPLFDEEFALVASPATAQKWITAEGILAGAPVVAYAESLPIIRRWWHTVLGSAPRNIDLVATVSDLRTITEMVAGGVGVSVLPTYLIGPQLADGSLVEVLAPEVRPLNTLFLATRAGERSRDRLLAQVIENLRALES